MRTPLRRYYHGRHLVAMRDVQAGTTRYYHFNHQGTVQCLTNEQGQVTDRFAADAWGRQVKRTGTSINRQWYIGNLGYYREVDRALDYVRARWLGHGGSRFLSCDAGEDQEATNLYTYVSNTPVGAIDPTGRIKKCPTPCDRRSDNGYPLTPTLHPIDCGKVRRQWDTIQYICKADVKRLDYPRTQAWTTCCYREVRDPCGRIIDYTYDGCTEFIEEGPDRRGYFSSLPDVYQWCVYEHEVRRKCICTNTGGVSNGGLQHLGTHETDRILQCVGNFLLRCAGKRGWCQPTKVPVPSFNCATAKWF